MNQPGSLVHKRKRRKDKPPSTRLDKAAAAKRLMIINFDGSRIFELVETEEGKQLAQLQRIVGGYIERVPQRFTLDNKPAYMFVNEDGLSRGLPQNIPATSLTGGTHSIVGVAVLIPTECMK